MLPGCPPKPPPPPPGWLAKLALPKPGDGAPNPMPGPMPENDDSPCGVWPRWMTEAYGVPGGPMLALLALYPPVLLISVSSGCRVSGSPAASPDPTVGTGGRASSWS